MIEYEKLKKSENGMPTWDAFIPVILEVAKSKKIWASMELKRAAVAAISGLPKELLPQKYKDTDYDTILENRAGWALSDLKLGGLLESPKRGSYQITPLGEKLWEEFGDNLVYQTVHNQPDYIKHKKLKAEQKGEKIDVEAVSSDATPEEEMDAIEKDYNSEVATNLLIRIRESDPGFFEKLVVNLLVKMGYQGKNGQSIVTKRSGDGGIDGIINQDPLGTQTVYIQAKRYKEGNNVQVGAIREFNSAVQIAHGNKGVFITTSKFSQGAKDEAKQFGIVLVDGIELTNLMLKYRLGVHVKKTFELLDIDEDFFEE